MVARGRGWVHWACRRRAQLYSGLESEHTLHSWKRIVKAAIVLKRVRGYWSELGRYLQWVKARREAALGDGR